MGKETSLTGTSTWVEIAPGGYVLSAPALHGVVQEMSGAENASRSSGGTHEPALAKALAQAGVFAEKVFEIEGTHVDPAGSGGGRADGFATPAGEPAMLLRVPVLDPAAGTAVLYTDEAGVSRWIFPSGQAAPATGAHEFLLPRDPAPLPPGPADEAPTKEGSRGPLTKLGRRLVRVLAWAAGDLVGQGALAAAAAWERGHRPYGLLRFPLDDARPVDWQALQGGRALLLVHGTFSSTREAFALMPGKTVDALAALYGGRVFAFDHPSLHHSPADNVERLLEMLPPDVSLEVDVVTHSRGGLVARELIAHQAAARRLRVRRAVFVAAPHRGTVLADGEHGLDMLDRYTNLFTELPDDVFTIGMEALFAVAKLAYHGAMRGLPGLRSMHPDDESLARLNGGGPLGVDYRAIVSEFRPRGASLLGRFGGAVAGALVDGVFGEGNDGVVPTAGGYDLRRDASGFPIGAAHRFVFEHADGVHHMNYFGQPRTGEHLLRWLGD